VLGEEFTRSVLGQGDWEVSEPLGSFATTRIARSHGKTVVVKLIDVVDVVVRLAEIGVTPPLLEAGEGYVVQQFAAGPQPDHAWYSTNIEPWASVVERYLYDEPLASLVEDAPNRERLTIESAADLFGDEPRGRDERLQSAEFSATFERWRAQATGLVTVPPRPIHADPHWATSSSSTVARICSTGIRSTCLTRSETSASSSGASSLATSGPTSSRGSASSWATRSRLRSTGGAHSAACAQHSGSRTAPSMPCSSRAASPGSRGSTNEPKFRSPAASCWLQGVSRANVERS